MCLSMLMLLPVVVNAFSHGRARTTILTDRTEASKTDRQLPDPLAVTDCNQVTRS